MSQVIEQKFKTLVHFIISKCDDPMRLGSVRLNKALWFSDVHIYKVEGESITGQVYIRKPRGPVPKQIEECLDALVKDDLIEVKAPGYIFEPWVYRSLHAPDVKCLSNLEQNVAEAVLNHVLGYSATDVSEMSHDLVWKAAVDEEEIPMCATLAVHEGPITSDVLAWAKH